MLVCDFIPQTCEGSVLEPLRYMGLCAMKMLFLLSLSLSQPSP